MKGKILILILGILVGLAAAVLWPRFVSPRLPAGLRSGLEAVDGAVVRKQRDGERLLLTVDPPQGAALATFTEKVAEIDLLGALSTCPGGDCGAKHSSDVASCYPLKVDIYGPDPERLNGWRSPRPSAYRRSHGH